MSSCCPSGRKRYFLLRHSSGESLFFTFGHCGRLCPGEVYNEMCTLCLAELPNVNLLKGLVDADRNVKENLKILGLGAGSTKRSAAKFRKRKRYDLPLFADEKWNIFGMLGKPMLPVMYLLKKDKDKGLVIMWRHSGGIGTPEDFLEHLKSYMKPKSSN